MKLNVGCGKKILKGYTNIDIVARPGVDIVSAASHLPMIDGCSVDEVLAIHVVEHFYPWDVPTALGEWARVLKHGGRLILEMPDVLKAAENLVTAKRIGKHPDQAHFWAIYGDDTLRDPYMLHKSGWYFRRLEPLVKEAGFKDVVERPTFFHPIGRGVRDFRLEAIKV